MPLIPSFDRLAQFREVSQQQRLAVSKRLYPSRLAVPFKVSGGSSMSIDSSEVRIIGVCREETSSIIVIGGPLCSAPGISHVSKHYLDAECGGLTPPHFDFYGNILFNDEKARLDNFVIHLMNANDQTGYIIAYAGSRARAGEAQARAERGKGLPCYSATLPENRLRAIDGGYREEAEVDLYVVPKAVCPPSPNSDGGSARCEGKRRLKVPRSQARQRRSQVFRRVNVGTMILELLLGFTILLAVTGLSCGKSAGTKSGNDSIRKSSNQIQRPLRLIVTPHLKS
jgi:hypothetical protein